MPNYKYHHFCTTKLINFSLNFNSVSPDLFSYLVLLLCFRWPLSYKYSHYSFFKVWLTTYYGSPIYNCDVLYTASRQFSGASKKMQ